MTHQLTCALDIRTEIPAALAIGDAFVQEVYQAASKVLQVSGDVSVSYVSDEEIHELNRTWRDVDRPTDVLSFALQEGEDEFSGPEEDEAMLGDVIVSIPTALRQADDYGHSPEREVGFLLVHGLLHLLGYDHQTDAEEAEMTELQEAVLTAVGLRRDSETFSGDARGEER